ncbi:MAG: PQQ-dependent sugar dehydrogenase [Desulfobulbaceae bacterium]|jgi:PQQ-dependent dehydrogenase (s-GDH family)|nr:PQQ-dependent sugar dehydrogenase [Desulfobulbaceae bacterium]
MNKTYKVAVLCAAGLLMQATASTATPGDAVPAAENFTGAVLAEGLAGPWEMLWGPDNMLWVTERDAGQITKVNPDTGEKSALVKIDDVYGGDHPQHEGLLGMAFSPDMSADKGQVYVLYTYKNDKGEFKRVARFNYDGKTLTDKTVILDGIAAGNDHQGGRLVFGPDGKLYLTVGELGHNQFGNACEPIEAQRLPTAGEVKAKNYAGYLGKTLRINPDGSIPTDNPKMANGVVSHVFTYGHRNPQGLVFVGDTAFSTEQGPSSDDELNILVGGGNYGWPHVAGFQDNESYRYGNWSGAKDCQALLKAGKFDANVFPKSVPVHQEKDWKAPKNFQGPLKTFYTVQTGYNYTDERCGQLSFLCWPTISPSSLTYYPAEGTIPGWGNSLLITSLKNGVLYRVPLSMDKKQAQGYDAVYFHTDNRYRVARVSPDGKSIFIATDPGGFVIGLDGKPTNKMANPGAILKFSYNAQ